jgi:replicative DNA helicase
MDPDSATPTPITSNSPIQDDAVEALPQPANTPRDFTLRDTVDQVLDHLQQRLSREVPAPGLPTGFRTLDHLTNGLRPGKVFVIAARPSMGKTSLMLNIAEHICIDQKVPSLIFSGEITAFDVVQRMMFSRAGFVRNRLYAHDCQPTKSELQSIQRAAIEISQASLFVDDSSGQSINTLRVTAHRLKREDNIGFIAIDHLQLIKSNTPQANQSHEREVAEVSAGIKSLAKELGVPILVLACLNRKPETRSGSYIGIPRLSDLRDSGAIENDADMVGLLYRPSYYAETAEDKEADAGKAELILAKNRDGETGWIKLVFIAELTRFIDHEDPEDSGNESNFRLNQHTDPGHHTAGPGL